MKTYKVTLELVLDDNASHPRKWVNDVIYENLETDLGEDLTYVEYEEVTEEVAQ